MLAFVSDYWLNVIVTWTWLLLDFFESLRFTNRTFELFFRLDLVVSYACYILWHEIRSSRFGNCWASSSLHSFCYGISSNSRMVPHQRSGFGPWYRISWSSIHLQIVCPRGGIIDYFMIGWIGWGGNYCLATVLFVIGIRIVLNITEMYIWGTWIIIWLENLPILFGNRVFLTAPNVCVRYIFDKSLRSKRIIFKASFQFLW
jgi:hypothetical protein